LVLDFAAVKRTEIERLRPLSNSDLPVMDLSLIQAATNNFSKENKLGEGGFVPVTRVRATSRCKIDASCHSLDV
jgi:hypothetical protein